MAVAGWTAVIVNYNGADYLGRMSAGLGTDASCSGRRSSSSTTPHLMTRSRNFVAYPRVNVFAQPRNLGFAGGANVGLAAVETEIALLMNPDVEVDADFGSALINEFAGDDRLGAAGALLRYPDSGRIQHAGGTIERPLMTTSHIAYGQQLGETLLTSKDVEFVTGGAMGLRISAVRAVSGFDEAFSPVYYEDVDLCVRLRDAGWRVRFFPTLRATHHEGVTLERGDDYHRHLHRNRIRYALKHLSGVEWRARFVPAEHERLRHELHTLVEGGWAVRSGAAGVESLLRGFANDEGWDAAPMLYAPPPAILEGRIDAARDLARPADDRPDRLHSIALRVLGLFRDVGLRRQVAIVQERQRQFNDAIVHALEAQDVMNREQTAMTLLMALDVLGRLQAIASETTAPPAER